MSFFQLVRREIRTSIPRLVCMSVVAGMSNAAILAAVNAGSQSPKNDHTPGFWASALFVIALSLYIKTQYYINITGAVEIEAIIHRMRLRLMDGIRRSELASIETIGRSRIITTITQDTALLKQASRVLISGVQGLVLIFFVSIYIAYLSLPAFLLSAAVIGVAAIVLHRKNRQLKQWTSEANSWTNQLFDRLSDLLDGFKEVRINKTRSDNLFEDSSEVSRTAANIKIWADAEILKQMVTTQSLIYLLLGAVVFVVPLLSNSSESNATTQTTMALLFIVGACFGLVQSIPLLTAADAAADRLDQLEADLRSTEVSTEINAPANTAGFRTINMQDVVFRYIDKSSEATFQVGPIQFILQAGELTFIAGGNGSGKSTFLKLLAGLVAPNSGEILLDGMLIDDNTRESYRALMSAIFTDYHLFKKLYGSMDADPAEFDRLLEQYQLFDKTRLIDNEFQNFDLSGGQRKRLALIVSLLEKRPILLLDEWTSDQDPGFRRKFYDELLPALKEAGKTVVVVTHDDRYINEFNLPARRLRMDEGRFVEDAKA